MIFKNSKYYFKEKYIKNKKSFYYKYINQSQGSISPEKEYFIEKGIFIEKSNKKEILSKKEIIEKYGNSFFINILKGDIKKHTPSYDTYIREHGIDNLEEYLIKLLNIFFKYGKINIYNKDRIIITYRFKIKELFKNPNEIIDLLKRESNNFKFPSYDLYFLLGYNSITHIESIVIKKIKEKEEYKNKSVFEFLSMKWDTDFRKIMEKSKEDLFIFEFTSNLVENKVFFNRFKRYNSVENKLFIQNLNLEENKLYLLSEIISRINKEIPKIKDDKETRPKSYRRIDNKRLRHQYRGELKKIKKEDVYNDDIRVNSLFKKTSSLYF